MNTVKIKQASIWAAALNLLLAASLCLVTLHLTTATASAFGEQTDEYTLELKGYSKELITPVQAQINRMEGRYAPKAPSKVKQGWYNFLNNHWIEPLEPFTYDTVDAPYFGGDSNEL